MICLPRNSSIFYKKGTEENELVATPGEGLVGVSLYGVVSVVDRGLLLELVKLGDHFPTVAVFIGMVIKTCSLSPGMRKVPLGASEFFLKVLEFSSLFFL